MPDNLEYRVECLEKNMEELRGDVRQIMRNHLPHIQVELTTLSTTIKVFGGLILSGITALILLGLTP